MGNEDAAEALSGPGHDEGGAVEAVPRSAGGRSTTGSRRASWTGIWQGVERSMRRDQDRHTSWTRTRGSSRRRLAEFPRLSAQRLFDEVRAAGYEGSYGRVRDHVRSVRPRQPVAAAVRFETPPGRQGQVDFGTFTLPWGRRHALLVVLGHSRLLGRSRLLWLHFYQEARMKRILTLTVLAATGALMASVAFGQSLSEHPCNISALRDAPVTILLLCNDNADTDLELLLTCDGSDRRLVLHAQGLPERGWLPRGTRSVTAYGMTVIGGPMVVGGRGRQNRSYRSKLTIGGHSRLPHIDLVSCASWEYPHCEVQTNNCRL